MRKKHPFEGALGDIKRDQKSLKDKVQVKPVQPRWGLGLSAVGAFAVAVYFLGGLEMPEQNVSRDRSSPSAEEVTPVLPSAPRVTPSWPQVTQPPTVNFNYVTTTGLNVRLGPGTNYDIVGTLNSGSCLKAVAPSYRNGWMTFDLTIIDGRSEGTSGLTVYLSERYLRQVTTPDHRCNGTIRLMPRYSYLGR